MKGTIKLHDKAHGFGFVVGEDGNEYYTRFEGLTPEEKAEAEKGMSVSFDLQEGLRGKEARNMKLI